MYQYFFEGDTVRLAYWRIDYDETKTMYANTEEAKLQIVDTLTAQGFTPTVTAIDQAGNEWIDGKCFTDHDKVEEALACGEKKFICKGDDEDIANTLTIMNDTTFAVDEDGVWHITAPGTPSLPCYSLMTCVTVASIDNQMISINGGAVLPLYKASGYVVLKNDIRGTTEKPVAVQINVTAKGCYLSASYSDGWSVGEVKHFGYKRPTTSSELVCDGSAYDKEVYPLLYDTIHDTYAVPPDSIYREGFGYIGTLRIAYGNGVFIRQSGVSSYLQYSTDGITWTDTSLMYAKDFAFANGIFVALVSSYDLSSERGGPVSMYTSTDGKTWTTSTTTVSLSYMNHNNHYITYSKETDTWCAILHSGYYNSGSYSSTILLISNDNWTTWRSMAAPGGTKPCCAVCPIEDGWIALAGNDVYFANDFGEEFIDTFEYRYTVTDLTVAAGMVYNTTQIGNKCALIVGDTLYMLGKELTEYFTDSGGAGCSYMSSNNYFTELCACAQASIVEIPDKHTYLVLSGNNICAVDNDGFKMPVVHSISYEYKSNVYDAHPGVLSAAYSPDEEVIMFTTNKGLYTLDVSNFALPDKVYAESQTYDYIKAE